MKKIIIIILGLVMLISFTSAALTDNLEAYYKMDDDAANTDVDDELDNHEGTLQGGLDTEDLSEAGKINNALRFDDVDDYIDLANEAGLRFNEGTQDFSVFYWLKLDALGTYRIIFDKRDSVGDGWSLLVTNLNLAELRIDGLTIFSVAMTDTNWHHIGFVVDRDGNAQAYLDGSASGTPVAIGGEVMDTTATPRIGRRSYGTFEGFPGLLDEFGIWDRTLTGDEITELWNEGNGLTYPFVPVDTCTYSGSGNWAVNCSDNCTISSNIVGDLSNLTIIGTGKFILNANISDFVRYYFRGTCRVTCKTGCFKE